MPSYEFTKDKILPRLSALRDEIEPFQKEREAEIAAMWEEHDEKMRLKEEKALAEEAAKIKAAEDEEATIRKQVEETYLKDLKAYKAKPWYWRMMALPPSRREYETKAFYAADNVRDEDSKWVKYRDEPSYRASRGPKNPYWHDPWAYRTYDFGGNGFTEYLRKLETMIDSIDQEPDTIIMTEGDMKFLENTEKLIKETTKHKFKTALEAEGKLP